MEGTCGVLNKMALINLTKINGFHWDRKKNTSPSLRKTTMGPHLFLDRIMQPWSGRNEDQHSCGYLVGGWVSTHLKNMSQIGKLPQIEVNIKNVWNHHLVILFNLGFFKRWHLQDARWKLVLFCTVSFWYTPTFLKVKPKFKSRPQLNLKKTNWSTHRLFKF